MKEFLTDYIINPQTSALLPARQIEYDTIVFEQDKRLHVKKTAMQLIEEACLIYGSTYEGRRKATMYRTDFKRKVPIPISINREIYTFPTHSPSDYDCAWIFPSHVQFIRDIASENSNGEKSLIFLDNQLKLASNASSYMIEQQLDRAELCKFIFSEVGMY